MVLPGIKDLPQTGLARGQKLLFPNNDL